MLPHFIEKLWHSNYVIADVTAVFVDVVCSDEEKILIKKFLSVEGILALITLDLY